MINRYPGTCGCGARVEAGAGEAQRGNDGRWVVRCGECAATHPAGRVEAQGATVIAAAPLRSPASSQGEIYTLLSGHPASPYQAAIFDHARYGRGSVIVKARAGVGKTTTMKNMVVYLPPRAHVQMFAFGTEAAAQLDDAIKELAARYPDRSFRDVRAGTFHSVGMSAVRRYLNLPDGQITVDPGKCRKILRDWLCVTPEGEETFALYASFVTELVAKAKGEGIGCLVADTDERWWTIVDHYGLYLDSEEANPATGIEIARDLLVRSNAAARSGLIDYDDMLFLVCLWKLRLWRNDVVVVDECFVPETPILVGLNGEQKTIKELYDSDYSGPIVTWSEEKGSHLSRVVGFKRVPVGKPMVRIRTQQRGHAKSGLRLGVNTEIVRYGRRTLVCTADHKIWTNDGWISAADLLPGSIVKHETAAPIVRSYQSKYAHTAAGRTALSQKADWKRFGGYAPPTFTHRGGNGQGLTRQEQLLLERLGEGWSAHYIVKTGVKRRDYKSGTYTGKPGLPPGSTFRLDYPTHYKLDLVNIERMIAVEID